MKNNLSASMPTPFVVKPLIKEAPAPFEKYHNFIVAPDILSPEFPESKPPSSRKCTSGLIPARNDLPTPRGSFKSYMSNSNYEAIFDAYFEDSFNTAVYTAVENLFLFFYEASLTIYWEYIPSIHSFYSQTLGISSKNSGLVLSCFNSGSIIRTSTPLDLPDFNPRFDSAFLPQNLPIVLFPLRNYYNEIIAIVEVIRSPESAAFLESDETFINYFSQKFSFYMRFLMIPKAQEPVILDFLKQQKLQTLIPHIISILTSLLLCDVCEIWSLDTYSNQILCYSTYSESDTSAPEYYSYYTYRHAIKKSKDDNHSDNNGSKTKNSSNYTSSRTEDQKSKSGGYKSIEDIEDPIEKRQAFLDTFYISDEYVRIVDPTCLGEMNEVLYRLRAKIRNDSMAVPISNSAHSMVYAIVLKKPLERSIFTKNDEAILREYAPFIALAITNAKEYSALCKESDKRKSQRDYLSQLLEIVEAISSELDIKKLSEIITEKGSQLSNSERCLLFLANKAGDRLLTSLDKGLDQAVEQSCNEGIVGKTFQESRIIKVNDADTVSKLDTEKYQLNNNPAKQILSVPIFNKTGNVIGVTQLINRKAGYDGPFTVSDTKMIQIFNVFCGIALNHSLLYTESQELSSQLKSFMDVSFSHSTNEDLRRILSDIITNMRKVSDAQCAALFLLVKNDETTLSYIQKNASYFKSLKSRSKPPSPSQESRNSAIQSDPNTAYISNLPDVFDVNPDQLENQDTIKATASAGNINISVKFDPNATKASIKSSASGPLKADKNQNKNENEEEEKDEITQYIEELGKTPAHPPQKKLSIDKIRNPKSNSSSIIKQSGVVQSLKNSNFMSFVKTMNVVEKKSASNIENNETNTDETNNNTNTDNNNTNTDNNNTNTDNNNTNTDNNNTNTDNNNNNTSIDKNIISAPSSNVSSVATVGSTSSTMKNEFSLKPVIIDGGNHFNGYLPLEEGLIGECVQTRKTISVSNVHADPRFSEYIDECYGVTLQNMILSPIFNQKGRVIGVAQLANKKNSVFLESDIKILKSFSTFASICLEGSTSNRSAAHLSDPAEVMLKENFTQEERDQVGIIPSKLKLKDNEQRILLTINFFSPNWKGDMQYKLLFQCFNIFDILTQFNITNEVFFRFIFAVHSLYNDLPYHNWTHACDATQYLSYELKTAHCEDIFSGLEIFSLLIATLCHDINHKGYLSLPNQTDNNFDTLEGKEGPLEILYKSQSAIETYHCEEMIQLLTSPQTTLLSTLDPDARKFFWATSIELILATDMALHFKLIKEAKALLKSNAFDLQNQDHRLLAMKFLLKGADIGNVSRPFPYAVKWCDLLYTELYKQDVLDRNSGPGSKSPLNKRNQNMDKQKSQIGFYNIICLPLFSILSKIFPELKVNMQSVQANLDKWKSNIKIF